MSHWLKVFLIFFAVGLLVYFNSLNNKFLIDDYFFINNPVFSQTKYILSQWDPYSQQSMGVVDREKREPSYRPMAQMTYDVVYSTFKNHRWEYRLLNLSVFVLASSLIFLLIEILTGNFNLAFLTGLFYLVHPINGIIVNYISANVFAFQLICMLGTILLLWRSLDKNNQRGAYFLSLVLSILSLFWHESGVMTFFYLSSAVFLFRKEPLKEKLKYLFPYFLILSCYLIFRFEFLGIDDFPIRRMFYHMNAGVYLSSLFKVSFWYTAKLFYPQGIVMQWATPLLGQHLFLNGAGALLLGLLFILLFIVSKNNLYRLALCWFLIGMAPVCLAAFRLPAMGAMIEPHWFIFSSIGFFIFVANACVVVGNRWKNAGIAITLILVVGWSLISHAYNRVWFDQKTYSLYWLQEVPYIHSTYSDLAYAYELEGDFKRSKAALLMSLSGGISDALVYDDLGANAQSAGDLKGAEFYINKALKINPYLSSAYDNLAHVYFLEGRLDESEKICQRALQLNPLLTKPRIAMAMISLKQGDDKSSIALCLKNLEIDPNDVQTLFLLVEIYKHQDDVADVQKYELQILKAQ